MSTDQNPTEHPEGLIEGLRQSAAGETEHLGSFEQYADTVIEDGEEDAPVRKHGDVFVPTAEEKASFNNLEFYELARATFQFGEIYLEPVRPGIVATYTDSDYGYLIQETESGFRFISVEAGETDDFGPFVKTQRAAVQSALADWRKYDDGHGIRWNWIGDITKDAAAPTIDAETIAEYLSKTSASIALTAKEIETISRGLAEHLAG